MRDLTLQVKRSVPRSKTVEQAPVLSPFLVSSSEIVPVTQYLSIRSRTEDLKVALSEFQRPFSKGDSGAVEQQTRVFMAGKRKEIERLKDGIRTKDEVERAHLHQVLGCLYTHLEVMAKLLKSLQVTKRSKLTRVLELEKARNSVLGDPTSFSERRAVAPALPPPDVDLSRENEQLLVEFQATDSEQVIEIQRSVMDINEMLSSFSMKVAEQQEISEKSKGECSIRTGSTVAGTHEGGVQEPSVSERTQQGCRVLVLPVFPVPDAHPADLRLVDLPARPHLPVTLSLCRLLKFRLDFFLRVVPSPLFINLA